MSRFKPCFVVLLLCGLALGFLPSPAAASECYTANNASAAYDPNQGIAWCTSATNSTCAQCIFSYYSVGFTICTADSNGFIICIDYQF